MAYVIAEPCIGVKDASCVDACQVDCIHPKKNTSYEDPAPGSMRSRNSISILWSALTAVLAFRFARCQPFFRWTTCPRSGRSTPN